MNIIFIGCVQSSLVLLNELLVNGFNVVGIVTKKNSDFNSDFRDLLPICKIYNIDIHYTKTGNDKDTYRFIKDRDPDLIYCFGWSHILSKDILEIPNLASVGFHPAKLPMNKGRHPLIWALVLGLKSTASTFFIMEEIVDNGYIISQVEIDIRFEDDAQSLYDKVLSVAKKQVLDITDGFIKNNIKYLNTELMKDNVWRKRKKDDGKIDFRMSAESIYNLIRGLTKPYVGAHFEYNGKEYKVWKSNVIYDLDKVYENIEPGKIIEVYSDTSFLVKTGENLIKIIESDEIILNEGEYI